MFFNTFITALCITLPILQPYVGAAVLKRDVFDPPITYPTAGTVWRVGETHNVTWYVGSKILDARIQIPLLYQQEYINSSSQFQWNRNDRFGLLK